MCKNLHSEGIPCTLILDSAIGYVMEQVDFVMVGAEGVVESGGIVNKVVFLHLSYLDLGNFFRSAATQWQCAPVS